MGHPGGGLKFNGDCRNKWLEPDPLQWDNARYFCVRQTWIKATAMWIGRAKSCLGALSRAAKRAADAGHPEAKRGERKTVMADDGLPWLTAGFLLWMAGAGAALADQGDFGQKVLGTIGLDAGSQAEEGVYFGDRFIQLTSDRLVDRHGRTVPVKGLDVNGFANVFAASGTYKLGEGVYYTAALGVPIAGISVKSDLPPNSLDRQGLGDIFVEPLKLGWRFLRLDITSSYAFYAPTGQLNRRGLAGPQWVQQFSAGGTVFFDDERSLRLSALSSYNLYGKKFDIDVTRGDSFQIQGGLGGRFFKIVDFGLAGYAMWQVGADTGRDIPPLARGLSEHAVGLGPELGITIPQLRAKLTARYEWEIVSRSRLDGEVLTLSLSFLGWRPQNGE